MPYLWTSQDNEDWSSVSLDDADSHGVPPLEQGADWKLMPLGGDGWALLCGRGANVAANGLPVVGIRILSHLDELVVAASSSRPGRLRMVYSAERPVCVGPFRPREGVSAMSCALCNLRIEVNSQAIVCQCGLVFHASSDSPCWTVSPRCKGCGRQTDGSQDLSWTPHNL